MRAVIIGGGKGCRAITKLALGSFLKEMPLDILCVVDPDLDAPGMVFARQQGIQTTADMKEALSIPDIKLVIELTGRDEVLENIYKIIPRGIKVFDHTFARVFVDLANAQKNQARQIAEIIDLEQKIEKERTFLQSVFDRVPELVAVVDRNKKIIKINEGFSIFTGFGATEAVGRSVIDLIADTELDAIRRKTADLLDEVLHTDQMKTMAWQSPPPNETFWEITHTPILGNTGVTEDVLCTFHRIVEQIMLQRKVESAELQFMSFIDSAHDWISVKDLDGRYLVVNKIAAQSFDLNPEDFVGKKPEEVLPASLAETITSHDKDVIEEDCYHSFNEIVTFGGQDHYFQTNRFPLKDFRGGTIGVCTIMRNVTSETVLRQQLEQAGKLAAIGKLAAGVAHEINNPLTGVLAYAEDLIEEMPEHSPQRDDLQVIVRETLRCRAIVRNLLDFSRQEDPKLESIDPNEIVKQSLSLVIKLPEFRNVSITPHLCEVIPSIKGDPQQIQQVLLNFILNAAEAMEGKGQIGLITEYDERKRECVIVVEDSGPGIPDNLKDEIFEPFFSTKGTSGLGLAVSWGIVKRHQGTIKVESSATGGASFAIIFPVLKEDTDTDQTKG
jgi:two-component system NtrC family sensor kinase